MSKRNLWGHEETRALLKIMQEKNSLALFDGKPYKNKEVYQQIENELVKRGYNTKNCNQIEIKWKNLKRKYVEVKNNNRRSGSNRKLCPYFEELDHLLSQKPSVDVNYSGIDTSSSESYEELDTSQHSLLESSVQSTTGEENENEPGASCSGRSTKRRKTYSGRGSYAKYIEKLGSIIKTTQEELYKDFLKNQKELIEKEFKKYQERDKEVEENFKAIARDILKESTNMLLNGLQEILGREKKSHILSTSAENTQN